MEDFLDDFRQTISTSSEQLLKISAEKSGAPRAEGKWSPKQIIGHLIDSASNNHQRFVRLQNEDGLVLPAYQQNDWVHTQKYAGREWRDLVEFWLAYNRHLVHVLRHADARAGAHVWKATGGDVTLAFLIEDYLSHLRHHLEQLLGPPA